MDNSFVLASARVSGDRRALGIDFYRPFVGHLWLRLGWPFVRLTRFK